MPGSLLLASNDTYSDLSYTSGRSLDSKTGPKKVSFNKAVRVKQYPWKPDLERNTAEHLTLPSSRFWFKVYKSKNDPPPMNNYVEQPLQMNAWGEDTIESTHDSLAPIAEVEDQDSDSNNLQSETNASMDNTHVNYNRNKEQNHYLSSNNNFRYHPTEPPVDYFDEMHLSAKNAYGGAKKVWETDEPQNGRSTYNSNNHFLNSSSWNHNGYGKYHEILEEAEENVEERSYNRGTDSATKSHKLPYMTFKNDSPVRRSVRKLDTSDDMKTRERRSRSHDDHFDNDSRFKHLRKADKSVSTDDLNSNSDKSSPSNRFSIRSRDMATQCYGTLNRMKNTTTLRNHSTSTNTHAPLSSNSDLERLKNFKSPTTRQNFIESLNSPVKTGYLKKDGQQGDFSKLISSNYDYQTKKNTLSNERNLNFKKRELPVNGKISNGSNKFSTRSENSVFNPLQKQNGRIRGEYPPKADLASNSILHTDSRNFRESNQAKTRDSATVGYLRGRQIPLSEVNTNTNRKFLSRNETGTNRNALFRKSDDNQHTTFSPSRSVKSDLLTSNGIHSKKYLSSNLENTNARNRKNDSHSAKSYSSFQSDGDNSMIDWSLSGFQLSTKPDNGITSMSDSEYTVHRRPPLLMYIPGVSHHDRPAVEDDRLSALSDISRSEMNDGLSSLANNASKSKNLTSDLRRRHSMPRDGKLKWIKWKNKG